MSDRLELEAQISQVKNLAVILDDYLTATERDNAVERLGPSITLSTLLSEEATKLYDMFESYLAEIAAEKRAA